MKAGDPRPIPYTEPMWLNFELKSLYYDESRQGLQKEEVRVFVDEHVRPEAPRIEEAGERPSAEIIKWIANVLFPLLEYGISATPTRTARTVLMPCVSVQANI